MGRPLMLDDLVSKRICDSAKEGMSRRCSAALAEVSWGSFGNWVRRGRAGEEPFATFLSRLQKAESEAERDCVLTVRSGSQGWQGSAWWLERRRRHSWRRPPMPAVQGEQDLSGVDEGVLVESARELIAKHERKTG